MFSYRLPFVLTGRHILGSRISSTLFAPTTPPEPIDNMFKHFILFSIITYGSLSFAGGPLVLEGRDGITPVTYQDPNITLHIENGDLGSITNEQADALVLDAFTLWNDISTATVNMVIDQSHEA